MANVLPIRYAKQVTRPVRKNTGSVGRPSTTGGNLNAPSANGYAWWTVGWQHGHEVCPSRYSAPRKAIFWMALKYNRNSAADTFDAQLIVSPASTSTSTKNIHYLSFPPGSALVNAVAGRWPWTNFAESTDPNWDSGAHHYANRGPKTTILGFNDAFQGDQDAQILTIEFDFFDPAHQDFWTDWNTAADDDEYTAFKLDLLIDMATWTAGRHTSVELVGCGLWIVQAPNPVNDTCTKLHMGHNAASYPDNAVYTRRTAYSTLSGGDAGRFRWTYRASEWDGITSVTALWGGMTETMGVGQGLTFKVYKIEGTTETVIYEQFFDVGSKGNGKVYIRSDELLSLLEDGATYSADYKSQGSTTQAPWHSWLEIIQKGCSKTVFYADVGREYDFATAFNEAGAFGGARQVGPGTNIWDPIFFQSMPETSILSNRIYGALEVQGTTNTERYRIRSSLDLNGEDDPPVTDPLAIETTPEITGSGGTLNEMTFQEHDLVSNNPRLLVGPRKMYGAIPTTAAYPTAGFPCCQLGVSYAHLVPESDVPELGDLFDLTEFNPIGCAATSAGLGDPGVLIITNGSVRPVRFNPNASSLNPVGLIPPFSGEVPTATVFETASSPDGLGLEPGTYKYRYTFRNCCTGRESDPSFEDLEVTVTVGIGLKGKVVISFADIRVPGSFDEDEICEICIYRTVNGGDYPIMAKIGCFDPSMVSSFTDDLDDSQLDFLNDPISQFNAPMPCVPYIAEFRNRIFGAGDIPDLSPSGTVSAVNGSDIIDGDGDVAFDQCMTGKFIYLEGDCRGYEIDQVLPPIEGLSPELSRLKLVNEYEGIDVTGANFIICGRPNRLYGTEPLEPESWPVVNFLDIEPGDGDRITGLFSNFDRLGICKRRKTYILAFGDNPFLEINVPPRISSDIGCIGPRTFAQIESGTVWLAERGIALYDGRGVQHVQESVDINDIFTDPDNPRYVRRNFNGIVPDAIGVFYPKREQYLLLVPTKNTVRGANLMVVWDIKEQNITLLEFCQEFQSMVVGRDTSGDERVYMGDTNGFVWVFDVGDTDGVGSPGNTGTVRGIMTDGGVDGPTGSAFIEDTGASFVVGGLPELGGVSGVGLEGVTPSFSGSNLGMAGACIAVRKDADSPWMLRTIWLSTSQKVYVTPSWPSVESGNRPEAGWEYMLGPIRWECVFKPTNMGSDDLTKRHWKQILIHEVEDVASEVLIELLPDFQDEDQFEGDIIDEEGNATGRTFEMDYKYGKQVRKVEKVVHTYIGVRMTNYAPEEPIRILNHVMQVTPRASR